MEHYVEHELRWKFKGIVIKTAPSRDAASTLEASAR